MASHERGRVHAKKRFGQHFLAPVWADKVVQAIDPTSADTFIEIGPGPGILTERLAARAAHVVAFEIDRDLVATLRDTDIPRTTIVEGDFLDVTADTIRGTVSTSGLEHSRLRVAGNLPYNVASPILFKLIELSMAGVAFEDASVMLQREVADRLLARPGTSEFGALTLLVGLHADLQRLLQLPAGAFRPVPKVQSTVVRLSFHPPSPAVADVVVFRRLTQALFSRRRKTLANALQAYAPAASSASEILAAVGIDSRRRPETLELAELVALANAVTRAAERAG